jgi:putative serine protease PepD
MSDTPGITPDETPAAEAAPATESAAAAQHTPAAEAPATPAADTTAAAPTLPVPPAAQAPQTPPVASATDADAQPTLPVPPVQGAASIPPVPPVPPMQAAPAYAAAPQPVHPKDEATVYAGQPYPGQAFGVPAQPVAGAEGAPAPKAEKKARLGAGAIVGIFIAAAIVGGAAGLGGAAAGTALWGNSSNTTAQAPAAVTVNNPKSVTNTTAVATKVLPSVVTINASSGSQAGTGSGVVLTADGYILTNTHVVTLDGATGSATLSVTTSDGHVYAASVVGTDPTYDLAVIKLKSASGLTPIAFGDSSKINVGDQTVAVGAPLGLSNTVTTGIVSALNRSIEIASSAAPNSGSQDGSGSGNGNGQNGGQTPFYFDFGQGQQQTQTQATIKIAVIQTDAAINPGNSGGALVDADGKLVGINVAIASAGSSSGGQSGSIGVGFSIPSDIAKRISDEIIKTGKATHGLLGATVGDAANASGATTTGALIDAVTAGGAAEKGGLQKGDVITQFNGVPITNSVDLTAQVRAQAAGSEATVTYVRDGKTHTTTVTLGELKTS